MRQKLRGFAAAFFLTLLFVGGIAGMTAVGYQASQALPADGWVELAREGETLRLSLSGKEFSFRITPLEQLRHWWSNTPPSLSPGRCGSPWGCWLWRSPESRKSRGNAGRIYKAAIALGREYVLQ